MGWSKKSPLTAYGEAEVVRCVQGVRDEGIVVDGFTIQVSTEFEIKCCWHCAAIV